MIKEFQFPAGFFFQAIDMLHKRQDIFLPVLMGGARVRVIGRQIYDQLLISYQWPNASALAALLVIAATALAFAAFAVTRRAGRLEQGA